MAQEIERKFHVTSDDWRALADAGTRIRQFYLASREGLTVRVRRREGRPAVLTLKTGSGLSRGEFEYDIPDADADALEAAHLGTVIEKRRHLVPLGSLTIEVDVFAGPFAPLVTAEIELPAADHAVTLPSWIGREVTDDPRYGNGAMALAGAPPPA
ncbi:CYTH domain-containing protein [Aureimonas pseudogalii]|uniref:Adenylate cyclase n=1 Tax=Aureimonas pseudogalii TaxID=1744844 RepID=A0A7W6MLB9_9HYPH|nr:CYTH domain-containing protein [Aureimonas pseudogalii]MBB3999614.1 adenylate cyclase [Aureimonas pseudogalii]